MSRSKKDGRKGGAHRHNQHKEVWSRRCPIVNMWDVRAPDMNRVTARYERRAARRTLRAARLDLAATETP